MSFFSKLIAGGLGFVLWGPIGALLALFLESQLFASKEEHVGKRRHTATQGDFRMSLLVLLAGVMKADGEVKKSELTLVKQYLVQIFGEDDALEALQLLKQVLQKDFEVEPIAIQVGMNMNSSSKLQLVHMLYSIAHADGEVVSAEEAMIANIARLMRLSELDVNSIRAMFQTQVNKDWAYEVLEITPNASNDDVKKAYRRMAMRFHPDKVATMGEDIKQSATEKFRKINEAYETVKKERNMG